MNPAWLKGLAVCFYFVPLSGSCDSMILPTMAAGVGGGWHPTKSQTWLTSRFGWSADPSEQISPLETQLRPMRPPGSLLRPSQVDWRLIRSSALPGPLVTIQLAADAIPKNPRANGRNGWKADIRTNGAAAGYTRAD